MDAVAKEPQSFEPRTSRPSDQAATPEGQNAKAEPRGVFDRGALGRMVECGCVTVIGLDAVRSRLGPRWPQRRERIWEAVQHHLSRRLGPRDYFARIDDVDILVATGDTREEAHAVSLGILTELLSFFLGEQAPADLRIEEVVSIDGDLIVRTKVDPATVTPALPSRPLNRSRLPDWSTLAFVSSDGRDIRVAFELERVFSLRSFAGAALRINPVLTDGRTGDRLPGNWREKLSFSDVLHIDFAALDALAPLRANVEAHKLVAPVSVETLFSGRGRAGVVARIGPDEQDGSAPIIEIIGVDAGTPGGRLVEAVSVLKRCAKAVIVRAALNRGHLESLHDCQLSGLSLDCSGAIDNDRKLLAALWSFSKAAKTIGPLTLALGLPSASACGLAATVGVTHASVRETPRCVTPAVKLSALEIAAA